VSWRSSRGREACPESGKPSGHRGSRWPCCPPTRPTGTARTTTMSERPEQLARAQIDAQMGAAGWTIQGLAALNLSASRGVAVRKLQSVGGPPITSPSSMVGRSASSRGRGWAPRCLPRPSNPPATPRPRDGSRSAGRTRSRSPTNPPASRPSFATNAIATRARARSSPSTGRSICSNSSSSPIPSAPALTNFPR
jgi:hypothetical protein